MSLIKSALLKIRSPLIEAKRFRGKINIQRPRKPHFERQLLIDLCKPFYAPAKTSLPDIETCTKSQTNPWKQEIENPFEHILAKECLNWFNKSKMIIFLHMNSINMEDKMRTFIALKKQHMHLRAYGKKIVAMATQGTQFENVNQLFVSHNNIIFGYNDNVGAMLKIMKRAPQMVVMAGILHGQFLSRNELVQFSQLPNLATAQSQLCDVLQSAGSKIVSQLNQHQQTLVAHLDNYVDISRENKSKVEDSTETPSGQSE